MMDELIHNPFERRIVGPHGSVLLRLNLDHARRSASAIQHRVHPAWSQFIHETHDAGCRCSACRRAA